MISAASPPHGNVWEARDVWEAGTPHLECWFVSLRAQSCQLWLCSYRPNLGLQKETSAPGPQLPAEKQPHGSWTAPSFSGTLPSPQQENSFPSLPQVPSL